MMVLRITKDGEWHNYELLMERYLFLYNFFYSFIYIYLCNIQQIECLYWNQRLSQWVLGWFFLNDQNEVKPVNYDTNVSQFIAGENNKKTESNTNKDKRKKPSPSTQTVKKEKNKKKRKKHHCKFCPKSYVNKQERISHENKKHKNIKPFICDFCDKDFYGADIKARHIRKCPKRPEKKKVNFI